jgi:hypothetical protein
MAEKLVPIEGHLNTPFALYGGDKSRILTVVSLRVGRMLPGRGIPAVLTDGVEWYSAELEADPTERLPVAYAVNGYADRETAEIDALSR